DEDGGPGKLTPGQHASCPGHAAFLQQDYGAAATVYRPVFIYTDPDKHGHRPHPARTGRTGKQRRADMAPAQPLPARGADAWVKAGNREARAARTERVKWLRECATGGKPPKVGAEFLAWYCTRTGYELRNSGESGHKLACEWLGVAVDARDEGVTAWGDRI